MKVARALGLVFIGVLVPWIGCSQNPPTVTIRSLERSGKMAFVCVDLHPDSSTPTLPANHCHPLGATVDKADNRVPHMIALVNQATRGEVAVVDITAGTVLDLDPSTPGFGFVPVGTVPTDIVATTGGTASFVSVADPNRPGIFALPTMQILPADVLPAKLKDLNHGVPKLTSFPACALPSPPGAMVIIPDWSKADHCPGGYLAEAGAEPGALPTGPDLSEETRTYGRAKLVVTMPELGQLAVIDASDLLARKPGSFDACPIESVLQLTYDPMDTAAAPVLDAGSAPPGDATCPAPAKSAAPPPVASPKTHPAQLAYSDDGRLFISDDEAPVIHVLDATSPCALRETAPLLAVSADDPSRSVPSDAIAVTPLTRDEKRYVYAVDLKQGSLMVFDVSAGSTSRTPLPRPDAQYTPFEPSDRIAFQAPVQSLAFARHDNPVFPPSNGVIQQSACDPTDLTNPYRPIGDFSTGAGPRNLRGIFGFVWLADGNIAVVDIDDLDAACRRPQTTDSPLLGCDGKGPTDATKPPFPAATGEVSCKVFERHRKRSAPFVITSDLAGQHAPSMQTTPLLYDKEGTKLDTTGEGVNPKLLGPLILQAGDTEESTVIKGYVANVSAGSVDLASLSPCAYAASCASGPASDAGTSSVEGGAAVDGGGAGPAAEAGAGDAGSGLQYGPSASNWVAFDLKEPRAHYEQTWTIIYEGVIPGFDGHQGQFTCDAADCEGGGDSKGFVFRDSTSSFCGRGVQDAALARQKAMGSGDWLSIVDPVPVPEDPYWNGVADTCSQTACQSIFGTPENPRPQGRDFEILEAYQDRVRLRSKRIEVPDATDPSKMHPLPLTCCFPYPVQYGVRAAGQWTVRGAQTGFQHHVVTDPASTDPSTARCVESCDPRLSLRNGRARMLQSSEPVPKWDDPRLFRNAMMRFAVWAPLPGCQDCLQRDMFFSFAEIGGFAGLYIAASNSTLVSPQGIQFVPGLEQLALSDANLQGLILVDLSRLMAVQTFY